MVKKWTWILTVTVFAVFAMTTLAQAHCEIPCGIYDDSMRIKMLKEHVMTMEKSMKKIKELEPNDPQQNNQLVRWINNKEEHAEKFQKIVNQYFLTQRIHLDAKNYTEKITLLHHMLVYAMKCKQTLDRKHIEKLYSLIDSFEELYFEQKK